MVHPFSSCFFILYGSICIVLLIILCVKLFELSWCCWSRFVVVVGMYWLYIFWSVVLICIYVICVVDLFGCLVDVSFLVCVFLYRMCYLLDTVGQNPAPVAMWFILFTGFYPSQVEDFVHQYG